MATKRIPVVVQKPVPSNVKEILRFFHCTLCATEIPDGMSPAEYQRIEAGFTPLGLQVWCRRHDTNIIHISFEGQKPLANTTRARKPNEVH